MDFKFIDQDLLVQTHIMQLIQENNIYKTPLLYFMEPRSMLIQHMRIMWTSEIKNQVQDGMVFKCENHDPLVHTHSTQLIQEIEPPCCILRTLDLCQSNSWMQF